MKENTQPQQLIERYLDGTATAMERAIVESWYENYHHKTISENSREEMLSDLAAVGKRLTKQTQPAKIRPLYLRWSVAASIALVIGAGLFYYNRQQSIQKNTTASVNAVHTGSNKAILTLASGKKIILDDAQNGQVAKEAGIQITKDSSGQLTYTAIATNNNETQYNTTTTPRGGQWHLILADGTNVWLNAQSSLTYPNAFKGDKREVKLAGEAYFEVAKDKVHPFIVSTDHQTVEVLGTHFNINSYDNEPQLKTTLLEGSVKVTDSQTKASQLLKPGEEANLKGNTLTKATADVDDAIAWKRNRFHFQKANIQAVFRDLARWYDIEVEFKSNKTNNEFVGDIPRDNSLQQTLEILASYGLKYQMNGKHLTITD